MIPVARARLMFVYTRKEPVGVCGQIIPWNFPLLMAAWKLAPALAAGCTVVLKPAEQTPLTRAAARRAGARGRASRQASSTSSPATARPARRWSSTPASTRSRSPARRRSGARSARSAGAALKRVTLELGGKSPNIILPDANLEAAIRASFQGIYFNSGQACNAGSRLFVHTEPVRRGRRRARRARRRRCKVGPGLDPETQLGPLVSAEQHDRVTGYIEKGKARGRRARRRRRARRTAAATSSSRRSSPTDGRHSRSRARRSSGRCSSPCRTSRVEEVAARANDTEYGLAAGVWTRDVGTAHRLAALLRRGHGVRERLGRWRPGARRSAASRARASAASTAAPASRRTSRPRRSRSRCRGGSAGRRSARPAGWVPSWWRSLLPRGRCVDRVNGGDEGG